MTPDFAAWARERIDEGVRDDGPRETPPVFGYVRIAVGADARERLLKEESFYRELHHGYIRHFDRSARRRGPSASPPPTRPRPSCCWPSTPLSTCPVVRGLASATVEGMTAVAEAAAP